MNISDPTPLRFATKISFDSVNSAGGKSYLPSVWLAFGLTALLLISSKLVNNTGNASMSIPHVGITNQNSWIARLGFAAWARSTIDQGYRLYRDRPFKICGNGVVVLPQRYINELRVLPEQKIGAMEANLANMQSDFAHMEILGKTNLFVRILNTRLTPKLGLMTTSIRHELDFAITQELPGTTDPGSWNEVEVFEAFHRLVGRLSARIMVGPELCRDRDWLEAAEGYSSNVFKVTVAMRLLPTWGRTPISYFVPHNWRVSSNFRKALRILVPYIEARKEGKEPLHNGHDGASLPDLLQSLTREAKGDDAKPKNIAAMVLALTLAGNHTTSMALTEAIFDLCEHPEYIPELREEIELALAREGGWYKQTITHLKKLDSFLKESQRLHPPSLMGYKRRIRQNLTLSDGLELPANAHVEFAIVNIQREHTVDPDVFDGLRFYKMRHQSGRLNEFQFASTSPTSLHFGHGQHSCPGRFTAAIVVKMILASLILDFDFKWTNSQVGRPPNIQPFEYSFPSPSAKIQLRRRQ